MPSTSLRIAVGLLVAALSRAQALEEAAPPAPPTEPAQGTAPALAPSSAEPAPPPPTVSTPGARVALTLAVSAARLQPHGDVAGVVNSSDVQSMSEEFGASGFQARIEGGLRTPFGLSLVAFWGGGPTPFKSTAGNGLCQTYSCKNSRVFLYGLEVRYHFRSEQSLQPFLGAGIAWERSGYDVVSGGETGTLRYTGMLFDLQGGLDYALGSHFFLGAFVADSFGQYDQIELKGGGSTLTGDIAEQKTHGWLQLGLRCRYDLPL